MVAELGWINGHIHAIMLAGSLAKGWHECSAV